MTDDKGAGEWAVNNPYDHEDCDSDFGGCGDKCKRGAYENGYTDGRSSRYGLRSQLVSNNTVLFDVASLVGSGKYFDAIELCHAKISGNNQAIEDDGEAK